MRILVFCALLTLGWTLEQEECLEKYQNEEALQQLGIDCSTEVLRRVLSTPGIYSMSQYEVSCRSFIGVVKCMTDEIVSDCGEEIRQPVYEGVAYSVRNNPLIDNACVQRLHERRKRFILFRR